jgi:hypothetical protein
MKYSKLDLGTIEAVVNKLGGMDGVARFLSNDVVVSERIRDWKDQEGVISLGTVTSDGTTGPQWIKRLEKKGFRVSDWARDVLNSKDFNPTSGVTTEIVVLKGILWIDNDRVTKNIRAEAEKRGLEKPNAEVACLIREKFSDEEIEAMGLWWIVAMHEPIKDSVGVPRPLRASRNGDGQWLDTTCGRPDGRCFSGDGFAFARPQVSAQNSES